MVKSTMSPKPSRTIKRHSEDMKSEIVVQVHKSSKREVSSDRETLKTEGSEESSGSNKTYVKDDGGGIDAVSREVSVDGESQINSKIISLIEAEMKRDVRHATFSDSRPQSLSFYEEEKMPEELSGNLELLSPEERKHYKRRKDYGQMDTDERNMYNSIQDIYNRENDEMHVSSSLKKSKSRKKKHGESELGDSREMMIPKEKRKSKKKKHESSPGVSGKRKHRKREDEYETRNEVTMALEDLQDDVFENGNDEFNRNEKVRKSPKKSDKLYVQKKNKFELSREAELMENHPIRQQNIAKSSVHPLQTAIEAQKIWRKLTTFCHGLLGGLGFAHLIYISTNRFSTDPETLKNYASYSETYVVLFYILCILCLLSVFDKYDIANLGKDNIKDMIKNKKSCIVIFLYMATLITHLVAAPKDDKIAMVAEDFAYALNITHEDLQIWNSLSFSRAFLAFASWFFVSLTSPEDFLYLHLKSLDTYTVADPETA
ncbi:PREDICTED: uncharacterized protein LOC108565150 [Nicrophorus vespilloides]|uniref:Uncharacterized protein LOC108565150 n=1 Tax=Nicrophorus vespilloides TaxID=110193 RepID=A0ABM1MZD4_NICVS|nr:PREDICTED: uncharacterized protein LOC108565150 [Nicrophorus vespilloides]